MATRLDKDTYFLHIAATVAQRSTCPRRQVGCVLVDSNNYIVATGYNGVPTGFKHCIDTPCPGANYPSGEGLEHCEAIHAEVNAFLQLRSDDELTAYMTVLPCFTCSKMFANSRVNKIVASEKYVHTQTKDLLRLAGIRVEVYDSN